MTERQKLVWGLRELWGHRWTEIGKRMEAAGMPMSRAQAYMAHRRARGKRDRWLESSRNKRLWIESAGTTPDGAEAA